MRRANVKFGLQHIFPLVLALAVPTASAGQQTAAKTLALLQPGTTLPVALHRALYAGKTAAGTRVLATTTQRVPIGAHSYLKHGAELIGEVTESVAGGASSGQTGTLSIRFSELRYRGRTVPLHTDAIAIANFTDADDTALPMEGASDRGNASPATWTTQQIGGDEVYRSGWIGPVCNTVMKEVGFADFHGVYSLPLQYGAGLDFPLAMGVFSTTAKGLYGFDEGVALRSNDGIITLTGPRHKVFIRQGDNLLLRVVEAH